VMLAHISMMQAIYCERWSLTVRSRDTTKLRLGSVSAQAVTDVSNPAAAFVFSGSDAKYCGEVAARLAHGWHTQPPIALILLEWMSLTKEHADLINHWRLQHSARQSIVPSRALVFSMESLAMRNRLQVSFWGLHLSADGIFAIAAALVIVIAILVASRLWELWINRRIPSVTRTPDQESDWPDGQRMRS
jgi:hypothetical protein